MEVQQEYDKGFYASNMINVSLRRMLECVSVQEHHNREQAPGISSSVYWLQCLCCLLPSHKAIQFSTPEAYQKLDNVISNRLKLPEKRKRYHHPNVSAKELMRNQEKVGSEN